MSATAFALLGYVSWTLLLVLVMESHRTVLVLSGRHAPDTFKPDGTDVSPFAHRLARAHANCYEHFPVIGGLLLLALVTGHSVVTDGLALWLLAARVAQSAVHLAAAGPTAVQIRFSLFAIQLVIAAWWSLRLLAAFLTA